MARGWESKSNETQQEAAAERRTRMTTVTADQSTRLAERATLSLARTRALADLQRACAPAHRAMLEEAIAELDRRVAAVGNHKTHTPKTQNPKPKTQIPINSQPPTANFQFQFAAVSPSVVTGSQPLGIWGLGFGIYSLRRSGVSRGTLRRSLPLRRSVNCSSI